MSSSGASSVTNSPSRHSAHSAQGVLAIPGSPVAGGRFVSPHIGSIDSGETFIDTHTRIYCAYIHIHVMHTATLTHAHILTLHILTLHIHTLTHSLTHTHSHTHSHTLTHTLTHTCTLLHITRTHTLCQED